MNNYCILEKSKLLEKKNIFYKIGIVFCGNQGSTGKINVLGGVMDYLLKISKNCEFFGFKNGPQGLIKGEYFQICRSEVQRFFNLGGGGSLISSKSFNHLNSGSIDLIETTIIKLHLHSIIFIGDSEDILCISEIYNKLNINIIFIPHGMNGDIYHTKLCPITLGFDSARCVLSEYAGNLAVDSTSSKKYYHFIRCGSSRLTVECAFQCRPTHTLVEEEIVMSNTCLLDAISDICNLLDFRQQNIGKRSGTILISDGLVDKLREVDTLRDEIEEIYRISHNRKESDVLKKLSIPSSTLLQLLPNYIRHPLLSETEPDGRPKLVKTEPAEFLAELCTNELKRRRTLTNAPALYCRHHYMGAEGRCAMPTPFDCSYGYTLGHVAGILITNNMSGYMACVYNLALPVDQWKPAALPIKNLIINQTSVNINSVNNETSVNINSVNNETSVNMNPVNNETLVNKNPVNNETLVNINPVNNETLVNINPVNNETLVNKNPVNQKFSAKKNPVNHKLVAKAVLNTKSTFFCVYLQLKELWHIRCLYKQTGPLSFGCNLNRPISSSDLCATLLGETLSETDFYNKICGYDPSISREELLNLNQNEYPLTPQNLYFGNQSIERMSQLQINRLKYEPQLPDLFYEPYKLTDADVARFNPRLENIFPITSQLRGVEFVGAGESEIASVLSPSKASSLKPSISIPCMRGLSDIVIFSPASRRTATWLRAILKIKETDERESTDTYFKEKTHLLQQGSFVKSAFDCLQPSNKDPLRIGICFGGKQFSGGMNIILGVFEYLKSMDTPGVCVGIVGGITGLMNGHNKIIDSERMSRFRNQGGLELICRTKECFSNSHELHLATEACSKLSLDGLILTGGARIQSDAAELSEMLLANEIATRVISIPTGIDNGIPLVEQTIGHDTACKTFSSIIGSLAEDARASNCWYFIRLTGHLVSHVCLECSLQTCPTICLISEEVERRRMGLSAITTLISDIAQMRSKNSLHYGVVLLPNSLLYHVPEMFTLIQEIEMLHSGALADTQIDILPRIRDRLTYWSRTLLDSLPLRIQYQICLAVKSNIPPGVCKIDLAMIETEVLLKVLVESELARRKSLGLFRSGHFHGKSHYIALQGRSAIPSLFDCDLAYTSGYAAANVIDGNRTGLMITVSNLKQTPLHWKVAALPITSILDFVKQSPGNIQNKVYVRAFPVKVSVDSEAFQKFANRRLEWARGDEFCNPGPIQYEGPLARAYLETLRISDTFKTLSKLKKISNLCNDVKSLCTSIRTSPQELRTALNALSSLVDVLKTLKEKSLINHEFVQFSTEAYLAADPNELNEEKDKKIKTSDKDRADRRVFSESPSRNMFAYTKLSMLNSTPPGGRNCKGVADGWIEGVGHIPPRGWIGGGGRSPPRGWISGGGQSPPRGWIGGGVVHSPPPRGWMVKDNPLAHDLHLVLRRNNQELRRHSQ
eukprot:GHVL01020015.1.p1 GENE.GHVL01020015.1~~GHVL01020015.1.p1  ORF type:complete len:1455 (+),score=293.94 GHVL01020015.1:23-4366(+)